jgi:hypothetical protein
MLEKSTEDLAFLKRLEGLELCGVVFVMDYLQLLFGETVMSIFTTPIITTPDAEVAFGQSGFADAICGQISRRVNAVAIEPTERITIGFDSGAHLRIPLAPELPTSAEAVVLQFSDEWTVI